MVICINVPSVKLALPTSWVAERAPTTRALLATSDPNTRRFDSHEARWGAHDEAKNKFVRTPGCHPQAHLRQATGSLAWLNPLSVSLYHKHICLVESPLGLHLKMHICYSHIAVIGMTHWLHLPLWEEEALTKVCPACPHACRCQ